MNIVIKKNNSKSKKNMIKLNNAINKGDDVFIFISANWCGHCKTTHHEWIKLGKHNYGPNIIIANVDSELNDDIEGFGSKAEGFPDLRYINKNKGIIEKFEDSKLPDTSKTFSAFDKWIKSKTNTDIKSKTNTDIKSKTNTNTDIKSKVYSNSQSKSHINSRSKSHSNKSKKHTKGMIYGGKRLTRTKTRKTQRNKK